MSSITGRTCQLHYTGYTSVIPSVRELDLPRTYLTRLTPCEREVVEHVLRIMDAIYEENGQ